MKRRMRAITGACLAAGALLLAVEPVDAQRRRAVVRARSSVVVGGAYYRPYFYDPWFFTPYYQWYPPPYYGYYGRYDLSGSLRLQVMPRQTEVFINGYYAGTVDDFDGVFQRLRLEPGEHDVELYLPGHRSFQQKVYLQPGRTFRVRHTMEPLGPGETEPAKPVGTAPPPGQSGAPSSGPPPYRQGPGRTRDRAQAPSAGFGSLALRVQPADADILIDGERWDSGDQERLVVQLAAGVHRVEVRKDGYRTYITEVTVRTGETETLNVAMSAAR